MVIGLLNYLLHRLTSRPKQLIEYKGRQPADPRRIPSTSTSEKHLHENS